MVKEILPGIFQIEVPLPRNPLRSLNSYLIRGKDRHLLVDTGFNWAECKAAQLEAIAELGLDWAEIDFFVTHVHGDHSGLVYALACPNSRVYCSQIDADILHASMTREYWLQINHIYLENGFPADLIGQQGETIRNFISGDELNFSFVQDGDQLEIGPYHLVCIATPGHSPGHMCLYEPVHKFLLSGDHLLAGITSNITTWGDSGHDYLGDYLASLDKVDAMDIDLVLPGHRQLIHDHHARIGQLKQHHERRLAEILDILGPGPLNAYQVASKMHWDLIYDSWEELPRFQRWFATGEAIAHLDHLVQRWQIVMTEAEGRHIYQLCP